MDMIDIPDERSGGCPVFFYISYKCYMSPRFSYKAIDQQNSNKKHTTF